MMKNNNWIYTYSYAPDSIWQAWRIKEAPSDWIESEATEVFKRLKKKKSTIENTLTFALMADSHYTINGTWEDTIHGLRKLNEVINFNGVIHLGDLTDGMLSIDKTKELETIIKTDLDTLHIPVYFTPGNHDYNYFKGNPELIYPEKPQYFVDFRKEKLRLIFIDSFDPKESQRYGFTDYCIHWLESVLYSLPEQFCAVVFSHITPLVKLQVWTKEIRNQNKLMDILNKYSNSVLAFINGHNHCDHLFNELYNGNFPIISINCAKCECFAEHKPDGAVVPYRELGNRTQESFDIMEINADKREIHFTRFGAGNDRIVKKGKAEWLNEDFRP